METVLSVQNLFKSYDKGKSYKNTDVSLSIGEGEIVGFLGMNGSGKTTLLKSITGIHPFDKGNIEICGEDIRKGAAAKRNFGYVPDNHATLERLTGREYVNFSADIYGVEPKGRNELIDFYLEKFKLAFAFDNQIRSYSHGMKQKIAIMAAFIHNPSLWLLDEPMVGLDVSSQREVLAILEFARENGRSVFFSSHNLDTVEKLCDRAIVISGGKIIKEYNMRDFNGQNRSLEDEFVELVGAK